MNKMAKPLCIDCELFEACKATSLKGFADGARCIHESEDL